MEGGEDVNGRDGVLAVRVMVVVEVKAARGSGSAEDPVRVVTEYWSPDGKRLAEADPVTADVAQREHVQM